MGLPPPPSRRDSGSGYGPFGDKAFKGTLVGCVGLVVIGASMLLLGGEAPSAVGAAFIVLGALGLVTGGAGLLAERLLKRRPPPAPEVREGNGRGPHRSRIRRRP